MPLQKNCKNLLHFNLVLVVLQVIIMVKSINSIILSTDYFCVFLLGYYKNKQATVHQFGLRKS